MSALEPCTRSEGPVVRMTHRRQSDRPERSLKAKITYRCNAQCWYCGYAGGQEIRDMPLAAFAELRPALEALRVSRVVFSGGECTLHPEFEAFVRLVRHKWVLAAEIATNGWNLDRPSFQDYVERYQISGLRLSLDAVEGSRHDRTRGIPDLMRRNLEGLTQLRALNCPPYVAVSAVVTSDTLLYVPTLAALIDSALIDRIDISIAWDAPSEYTKYENLPFEGYVQLYRSSLPRLLHAAEAHGVAVRLAPIFPSVRRLSLGALAAALAAWSPEFDIEAKRFAKSDFSDLSSAGCALFNREFTLRPDGALYSCCNSTSRHGLVGNLFAENDLESLTRLETGRRRLPECVRCPDGVLPDEANWKECWDDD